MGRDSELPAPTERQRAEFSEHLPWAHSWYKHLSLLRGGRFLVFLACDAGAGYETKERRHYGWKTTAEYRKRFGHLAYAYLVDEDEPWRRDEGDAGLVRELPSSFIDENAFTLFPFVSSDYSVLESLTYDVHEEDLKAIRATDDYPHRAAILAWSDLYERKEDAFASLDDADWDALRPIEEACPEKLDAMPAFADYERAAHELGVSLTAGLTRYLRETARLNAVYASLQRNQQARVDAAVRAAIFIG